MIKRIFIVSLFVAGVVIAHSQEYCDTLKWKSLKTYYLGMNEGSFYRLGQLDGAIINIDTLPVFYLGFQTVNISNDTYFASEGFAITFTYIFYADTGMIGHTGWQSINYPFNMIFFPNDTIRGTSVDTEFDLPFIINQLQEVKGVELEEVSYWQIITGIFYTTKDGYYSDSVFSLGADTSTFYVVRGNTSIQEIENPSIVSVYPNPTTCQLRITNYELREGTEDYTIYNVVGQKILQGKLQNEISIINVASLARGMYYLRVGEKTVKFVKE